MKCIKCGTKTVGGWRICGICLAGRKVMTVAGDSLSPSAKSGPSLDSRRDGTNSEAQCL